MIPVLDGFLGLQPHQTSFLRGRAPWKFSGSLALGFLPAYSCCCSIQTIIPFQHSFGLRYLAYECSLSTVKTFSGSIQVSFPPFIGLIHVWEISWKQSADGRLAALWVGITGLWTQKWKPTSYIVSIPVVTLLVAVLVEDPANVWMYQILKTFCRLKKKCI